MEITTKQEQMTAGIRLRTPVEELKVELGKGYGEIAAVLGKQGVHPIGPPFALYYNMDMKDLDVEMGFPISGPIKPEGRVRHGMFPGGRTAMHVHKGSYEAIGEGYNALTEFMTANKVTPKGPCYEIYLTDPQTTSPQDLMTEIGFPLEG